MAELTRAELELLEENLIREHCVAEKYLMYSDRCADPQLKTKFSQMSARHMNHFGMLLEQLR